MSMQSKGDSEKTFKGDGGTGEQKLRSGGTQHRVAC